MKKNYHIEINIMENYMIIENVQFVKKEVIFQFFVMMLKK